jgi:hypothetical protein
MEVYFCFCLNQLPSHHASTYIQIVQHQVKSPFVILNAYIA